jgi:hypothetical protein
MNPKAEQERHMRRAEQLFAKGEPGHGILDKERVRRHEISEKTVKLRKLRLAKEAATSDTEPVAINRKRSAS